MTPDPHGPPRRPPDDHDPFPEARPFRRIQAATALLLAVAAVVTLLSDERPAAVRWSAAVGVGVLALVIWLLTRERRSRGERHGGENSRNAGDM